MKHIRESLRKTIKEMEEDNAREIHVFKTIKKYFDDFGPERGVKLLNAIAKQLASTYKPTRVTDTSISPEPVMEMMMGPEDKIEDLGDSLMSSSKLDSILTNTYASDFNDEFEYADNIITFLIDEYEDYDFYNELYDYMIDVYAEKFIELYRSGDDDYFDGDNDEEFFV
jgi:hypothetical protein